MTLATDNFGAYLLQPINNTLLIGCGNSPGNENGCQIFNSSDGVTFTHEFTPSEQGSNVDGQLIGNDWWVCGQDPTDDWTLGNIYHRNSNGVWTKIRTLPLTIHALGLWTSNGTDLWVVGGMHAGDNVTWKGRVLHSIDSGNTWSATDVNNYRLYDIIKFNNKYYATGLDWTGSQYTYDLHVSDDGSTWSKIDGISVASKPRLIVYNNRLVAVGKDFLSLITVDTSGVTTINPTSFNIQNQWNVLCDGEDGYLYVLSSTGVYRTNNFSTWIYYCSISNSISIRLWPGTGLMVSTMGTNAQIFRIPL